MSAEDYDMIVKIVIIGDSFVGKSNLLLKYLKNEFNQDSKSTVGVEFGSKSFNIQDSLVKVQIWDTAGQDRFKAITKAYYKGARGAFIVYDITRKSSFESIDKWILDLKENTNTNISMMLIGNKNDLEQQREVSTDEAMQKAIEYKVAFMETSAKTGANVEKAFEKIVNDIVKSCKLELESQAQGIDITETNNINLIESTEVKKKCCQ